MLPNQKLSHSQKPGFEALPIFPQPFPVLPLSDALKAGVAVASGAVAPESASDDSQMTGKMKIEEIPCQLGSNPA